MRADVLGGDGQVANRERRGTGGERRRCSRGERRAAVAVAPAPLGSTRTRRRGAAGGIERDDGEGKVRGLALNDRVVERSADQTLGVVHRALRGGGAQSRRGRADEHRSGGRRRGGGVRVRGEEVHDRGHGGEAGRGVRVPRARRERRAGGDDRRDPALARRRDGVRRPEIDPERRLARQAERADRDRGDHHRERAERAGGDGRGRGRAARDARGRRLAIGAHGRRAARVGAGRGGVASTYPQANFGVAR